MKTAEVKMPAMHQLHSEWKQKLQFYKDDLESISKRLEEVVIKNSSTEVLAQAEHFQNQFIIQRNEIDILLHDINQAEQAIQDDFKINPTAWDHRNAPHTNLQDLVHMFEVLFSDMHSELHTYLSKYL
jgi:hypothetical protein